MPEKIHYWLKRLKRVMQQNVAALDDREDVLVFARGMQFRRRGGEEGLVLGGVMAMAPLGVPPAEAFAPLPRIAGAVRAAYPQAVIVSAGMSGDLEDAIAVGATHVRVGTALLGGRPGFVR